MYTKLILLIGTNPLPNYVVAHFFLNKYENVEIYLVYSEKNQNDFGTGAFAENLKEVLIKKFKNCSFKLIGLEDKENPDLIFENTNNKIVKNLKDEDNIYINLNYTGGTKSMAVHVYRTLEKGLANKKLDFSYLSARDFSLKFDSGEIHTDLRRRVNIDLKDLLQLHDYQTQKTSLANSEYAKALSKLDMLVSEGKINEFFTWKRDFIENYYKRDNELIEKPAIFRRHVDYKFLKEAYEKAKANYSWLFDFLCSMPSGKSLLVNDDIWYPIDTVSNADFKSRLKDTIKFIDGVWLEHHVFEIIKEEIVQKQKVNLSLEQGWEIKKRGQEGRNFELDVMFINGYQTTVISCTTAIEVHICKSKGFEVLHRASEIGGDESKAVLICALNEKGVEELQDDLNKISNLGVKKLKIFGVRDWHSSMLSQKIGDFIFS